MTTDLETLYRVLNVAIGFLAGMAVLMVVVVKKPSRWERWGLVGGAFLCFAVALGTLGRLLGWHGEIFLPFVTASLVYVLVGRVLQLVRDHRR